MINFNLRATPSPFAVALILEEFGLKYEVTGAVPSSLPDGALDLPGVVDDGVAFFDSNAIVLHMAQKHGAFVPSDPTDAAAWDWFFFVVTGIAPPAGLRASPPAASEQANSRMCDAREVSRRLALLDARLGDVAYLGGAAYSIADIAAWGWVEMAHFMGAIEDGLTPYPNLMVWRDKIAARPAAKRAKAVCAQLGG